MIWVLLKLFPQKTILYIIGVLFVLHILGVYPLDVLILDILTVIAGIIDAVVDWITGLIQQAVDSAISGGI